MVTIHKSQGAQAVTNVTLDEDEVNLANQIRTALTAAGLPGGAHDNAALSQSLAIAILTHAKGGAGVSEPEEEKEQQQQKEGATK
jgi:hypothetical protein